MKRHGILVHVEPVMPEFDDIEPDTLAFIAKAKASHDPEPDPYHSAVYQRLNFGDLG